MNTKPIVLVDMDAVLADFYGATIAVLRREHPEIEIVKEVKNYRIELDYPEIHHELIKEIFHRPGFFSSLPLIDGAIEGWALLEELGYDPEICSSPVLEHVSCEQEKLAWLTEHFVPHFGQRVVNTAHITRYKAGIKGFALIDDRPEIYDSDKASWKHIVFNQPYNTELDTPLRIQNWSDPAIKTVLAEALRLSSMQK